MNSECKSALSFFPVLFQMFQITFNIRCDGIVTFMQQMNYTVKQVLTLVYSLTAIKMETVETIKTLLNSLISIQ